MNKVTRLFGRNLAHFLGKPVRSYQKFSVTNTETLRKFLQPGDILLVEGNLRISVAIKYLTQSTWSHAAMYVGDTIGKLDNKAENLELIEADLSQGVIPVPLSKYAELNTRICRPIHLLPEDQKKLINYMINSIGMQYDLKNIIDLMRYLLPTPPVPVRWRRQMLAFGSGDPTRAVCSTLIAQAFQHIKYPILPDIELIQELASCGCVYSEKEVLHIRHHSLFAPRDFDLSPYFNIVKPTTDKEFNYKTLNWAADPSST